MKSKFFTFFFILSTIIYCIACSSSPSKRVKEIIDRTEKIVVYPPRAHEAYNYICEAMSKEHSLSKADEMALTLMKIRAKDKCEDLGATSDSIKDVVKYYEKNGDSNQKMMAYYYMAGFYRDKQDYPSAIEWLQKAAGVADTTLMGFNWDCLCGIYGQMDIICHNSKNYQMGLLYAKESLKVANSKVKRCVSYYSVGHSYNYQYMADSCLYYYRKAFELLKQFPEKTLGKQQMINGIFNDYLENGFFKDAKAVYPYVVFNKRNPQDLLFLGSYHEINGNIDSAKVYYIQSLQYTPRQSLKSKTYRALGQIYRKEGNSAQYANCMQKYAELVDSMRITDETERIAEISKTYNYQQAKKEKEEAELREKNNSIQFLIVICIILSALLCASVCFIIYRSKAKKQINSANMETAKAKKQVVSANMETAKVKKELGEKTKALEMDIASRLQQIDEMAKEIIVLQNSLEQENQRKKDVALQANELLGDFHVKAKNGVSLTAKEWQKIDELGDSTYPQIKTAIMNSGTKVSVQALRILYLRLMNFGMQEIATLLSCEMSRQNVHNQWKRMCTKMEEIGVDLGNQK